MVEVHVPRVITTVETPVEEIKDKLNKMKCEYKTPVAPRAEEDNRVTIVSLRRQLTAMEENMHKMECDHKEQIEIMEAGLLRANTKRCATINELVAEKCDNQKVIAQLLEEADRVKVLNKDIERELEECKKTIAWHDENDQATWDVAIKWEKKYKKLKKRLKLVRQQLKC